ncbi:MAG: hypothetical protein ACM3S2_08085 [Ignavibacteriales bacterium]
MKQNSFNLHLSLSLSVVILLYLFSSISAQVVYEPVYKDVYTYLGRLSQKGIIIFDDQIKPLSRKYIAEKLLEADADLNRLTPLEKEELDFYKKDYYFELHGLITPDSLSAHSERNEQAAARSTILGKDPSGRNRLFSYDSQVFKVNVSPIIGYEAGKKDQESYSHKWTGLYFYGYLANKIGFSFDYRDNTEKGNNADKNKIFSPVTGNIIALQQGNSFDYSEARTSLAVDWSWGSIAIAKDFLEWGYGESGKLVLSSKAPSFPFIRLDIKPVDWLSFNYIHAWLNSDVVDSQATYASYRPGQSYDRVSFRQKFLASHSLNIRPVKGLDVTLGESIIYSDRLEVSYFMPLMFFRLADHYLSQGRNNAGGNAQFFGSISSRNHIKNTHLYGTMFIDELTLSGLLDPEKQRTQVGFTLGGSIADLSFLNLNLNLSLTLEYTKIYPFVYKHYIPTLTYTSSGYGMGHWMGDNADLFYGAVNYRFLRGLQATLWGEHVRKGEYDPIEGATLQYVRPQPPFLFGLRNNYTWGGVDVKYEITHELFARARFVYNSVDQEQTRDLTIGNKFNEMYLSVYYGL